jgi:MFS family permease
MKEGNLYLICLWSILLIISVDVTATNLIIAPIATSLSLSLASAQWITNSYLVTYASFIILSGQIGDLYSKDLCLKWGLFFFTLGSLVSSQSATLLVLCLGRSIQGFGAALINPNATSLLYEYYTPKQKGYVSGLLSSFIGASIAAGPLVGGLLTSSFSWKALFIFNIFSALSIYCFYSLSNKPVAKHNKAKETKPTLNWYSICLLVIALLSVTLFLDFVMTHNINLMIFLLSSTIATSTLFFWYEKRCSHPIFNAQLLRNKHLKMWVFIRFLYGIVVTIPMFMLALFLQLVLHYTPLKAGLFFLPFTIAMMIISPYVGRLIDHKQSSSPIFWGMTVSIACLILFANLKTSSSINLYYLLILFTVFGLSVGTTRSFIVAKTIMTTPEKQLSLINSVTSLLTNIGSILGLALCGLWFDKASQKHIALAKPITHNTLILNHTMPTMMFVCIILYSVLAILIMRILYEHKK